MTDLITGVGCGQTSAFGAPGVQNLAQAAYPPGIAGRVGRATVYYAGANGAAVLLDLTGSYVPPPATAVYATFAGALVWSRVSAGDTLGMGAPSIANVARSLAPAGLLSEAIGRALTHRGQAAAGVLLDLDGAYTSPPALNVPFYFAGAIITTRAGAGDTLRVGAHEIVRGALGIAAQGIAGRMGAPKVHRGANGASVDLLFVAPYSSPRPPPVLLHFNDESRPITHAGAIVGQFGQPSVANAARSLAPGGIVGQFGLPRVYLSGPNGALLELVFQTNYAPPTGANVPLTFEDANTIDPNGLDATLWGSATIALTDQAAAPSGFDAAALGDVTIAKASRITPAVFDEGPYGLFGRPTVELEDREIRVMPGFESLEIGAVTIAHYVGRLRPDGIAPGAFGAHEIAGGVRALDLTSRGIADGTWGDAFVSLGQRELFPPWFTTLAMGIPQVGYAREIAPPGFDALIVGTHTVRDNHQEAAPPSLTGAFGQPFVANRVQIIAAQGAYEADEFRFGRPEAINLRAYIRQAYIASQWIEGEPGIPWVRNRNMRIDLALNGIAPPFRQVPLNADVALRARAIAPAGLDATLWGAQLAAYRNRTVTAEGIAPPVHVPSFHVIYNTAVQAFPLGVRTDAFGAAFVENTRRYFPYITAGALDAYGTPFVAFAIRTIDCATRGIETPLSVPEPTVWHRVRSVQVLPPDFPGTFFGIATLDRQDRRIRPVSILSTIAFGTEARVTNRTPHVRPYHDEAGHTEWGAARIANRNVYVSPPGIAGFAIGLHFIRDRRSYVQVPGILGFRDNPKHVVRNNVAEPPGTQRADDATLGLTQLMGLPTVTANSIYPVGFEADAFGEARVVRMGISPRGIPPIYDPAAGGQLGLPRLSSVQYVNHSSAIPPDGFLEIGTPRLSPWTIYAPAGAPQQAKDNHPPGQEHPIDFGSDPPRQGVGVPTVSNYYRSLAAVGSEFMAFGAHRVSLNPQVVLVDGTRQTKYGFPLINNGRPVRPAGLALVTAFGTATVTAPPPFIRYLGAAGFDAFETGQSYVDLLHRALPVDGIAPGAFGTTIVQRPPPPALPAGFVAALWGDALVAYRIRTLQLEGWDSFECDHTPGYFKDRMRVRTRNVITPFGFDSLAIGTPMALPRVRTLHVHEGINDGALGAPLVRGRNEIAPAGLDATIFGNFVQWAPTLPYILPYGDDLSLYGIPTMGRGVLPGGMSGTVGVPSVSFRAGVAGFSAQAFGEHVAMAFGCGRQARVIVGWDSSAFGTPTVG